MNKQNNFEKILNFCIKNKVDITLGNHGKHGKHLTLWRYSNSFYQIQLFDDLYISGELYKKSRTTINLHTFDTECYKSNGDAYQGEYDERFSFKAFMEQLNKIIENNERKNGWIEN